MSVLVIYLKLYINVIALSKCLMFIQKINSLEILFENNIGQICTNSAFN